MRSATQCIEQPLCVLFVNLSYKISIYTIYGIIGCSMGPAMYVYRTLSIPLLLMRYGDANFKTFEDCTEMGRFSNCIYNSDHLSICQSCLFSFAWHVRFFFYHLSFMDFTDFFKLSNDWWSWGLLYNTCEMHGWIFNHEMAEPPSIMSILSNVCIWRQSK